MKKRKMKFIIKGFSILVILSALIMMGILFISYTLGPPPLLTEQNTVLYTKDHEKFAETFGNKPIVWRELDMIPTQLKDSFLVVEDRKFYEHHGFDFPRIARALFTNITAGSLKSGASTISQQYARNLYLSHEKTWLRKMKEAFYTIRLEMHYSKDEIFAGYLNTIYFGHGVYGIEAASQYFFGKDTNELSIAETAMLVGIPKGPSYYSPFNNEKRASGRQQLILNLMYEQGKITEEDLNEALATKLIYKQKKQETVEDDQVAAYFRDTAIQEAGRILSLSPEEITAAGFHIDTTLDLAAQQNLANIAKQTLPSSSELEIGALAIDPTSGAIQALLGGKSYQLSTYNRATTAKRMPGSTFKPILYAAALQNGFTPSTTLISQPTTFKFNQTETYKPNNYHGYYANKPITLAQAIALSDNIFAVKTAYIVGLDTMIDTAKQLGIKSQLDLVPSLALGTSTVSLNELMIPYSIFANGGKSIETYTIEKITNRNGKVLYERKSPAPKQVFPEENAFLMTQLLTGMFDSSLNDYTSVTGSPIIKQLSQKYAGKSGTTASDSWMIGYSPTLVTGIWTGYDDNRTIEKVKELTYAKEIWAKFMEETAEKASFTQPKNISAVEVDPETGLLATENCPVRRKTYYLAGTEPTTYCTLHLSEEKSKNAQEETPRKSLIQRLFEIITAP